MAAPIEDPDDRRAFLIFCPDNLELAFPTPDCCPYGEGRGPEARRES